MLEVDLEDLLKQKRRRFDELNKILDSLNISSLEVSYTLDLTKKEQINYTKVGLYYLWRDLDGRTETYTKYNGQDN